MVGVGRSMTPGVFIVSVLMLAVAGELVNRLLGDWDVGRD